MFLDGNWKTPNSSNDPRGVCLRPNRVRSAIAMNGVAVQQETRGTRRTPATSDNLAPSLSVTERLDSEPDDIAFHGEPNYQKTSRRPRFDGCGFIGRENRPWYYRQVPVYSRMYFQFFEITCQECHGADVFEHRGLYDGQRKRFRSGSLSHPWRRRRTTETRPNYCLSETDLPDIFCAHGIEADH
jgi:hypothetical protein